MPECLAMPRLIIALCGRKGSGKDAAAALLARHGYVNEKIAAPLKAVCAQLFGLTPAQMEGVDKERVDPRWRCSPRRIMQFVGTEMFQGKLSELLPHVGRSFWVDALVRRLHESTHERVVVTDMRFPHERAALDALDPSEYKTFVIRLTRQGTSGDAHESENTGAVRVDCDIENDGTLDDLANALKRSLPAEFLA